MEGHVLNTTPLKQHLLQIPRQQSYVMTVMLQRPPKRVASPQGASAPRLFSRQLSDEAGATVDQAGGAPAIALAPQEQQRGAQHGRPLTSALKLPNAEISHTARPAYPDVSLTSRGPECSRVSFSTAPPEAFAMPVQKLKVPNGAVAASPRVIKIPSMNLSQVGRMLHGVDGAFSSRPYSGRGSLTSRMIHSSYVLPSPARPIPGSFRGSLGDHQAQLAQVRPSCLEGFRDRILAILSSKTFNTIGILWIILVVITGAFFFFTMLGVFNSLIKPEGRKNFWYNASIQALNWLFTYSHIITLPWRLSNLAHLSCSKRSSAPGFDFYGNPTQVIWFHLKRWQRRVLLLLLFTAGNTQFANQYMRIKFWSFDSAEACPSFKECGVFWVNIFFGLSFLCGCGAGIYQTRLEAGLRKRNPGKFDDGPIELLQRFRRDWRLRKQNAKALRSNGCIQPRESLLKAVFMNDEFYSTHGRNGPSGLNERNRTDIPPSPASPGSSSFQSPAHDPTQGAYEEYFLGGGGGTPRNPFMSGASLDPSVGGPAGGVGHAPSPRCEPEESSTDFSTSSVNSTTPSRRMRV